MTETLSVIVASYLRPERLAECLAGLRAQRRPVEQVLVGIHESDTMSARRVDELRHEWAALAAVTVTRYGTVASQNRALPLATGSIVAFCDDDAVPHPDWAERLIATFGEDPRIAAVGGRDLIYANGVQVHNDNGAGVRRFLGRPDVGRIQWFGRMVGNHHLPGTRRCDTDVLKGVNMAFRREHVVMYGFDERLLGDGAIVHSEMSICLPLRRQGLRVVFDPQILVDHRPAPRGRGVQRDDQRPEMVAASSHNEALALLDYLDPRRRAAFATWSVLVGTGSAPGLVQLTRDLLNRRPGAWPRFVASQQGRARAWHTHITARRPALPLVDD